MACPLDGRRTGGHQHSVSHLVPGPLTRYGRPRRALLSDRCNSALLWSTISRAVMLDQDPRVDGKPLTRWGKAQAWAYLLKQHRNWRHGITPPDPE